MNIKENKKIMVHAYKRNGWLYRIWEFPEVLLVTENYVVVSLFNSKVITSEKYSKRCFVSKNYKNAFWFFYPDKWYNIIATLLPTGIIAYYVNIASPFIYEEEAIKYYDFDLDIKMSTNKSVHHLLDKDEYEENKVLYHYEKEIIENCENALTLFKNEEFRKEIMDFITPEFLEILGQKRKVKF
ncbi:MAG: DUF402 domain-containing protein [Malacoplasma sp.]|nr:DUF402 domain-containing protein [Malacoplasma sp.]